MTITARPYETDADLRLMQSLQQELWALEGERTHTHVGDLAWWATMHTGREAEWNRRLAIVYAGGRDEDLQARALYESVGFRRHTRVTELRKDC